MMTTQMLLLLLCATFCHEVASYRSFYALSSWSNMKLYSKVDGRTTAATIDGVPDKANATWPGDRPPMVNLELLEQRMDATWGRGKYRTEVWDDDMNPVSDWWTAYAPSEEQIEAAAAGYDFKDSASWLKERGIDYDQALIEVESHTKASFEKYIQEKESEDRPYTMQELEDIQTKYLQLQELAFKASFRLRDDILQRLKGQPSLDAEDTGVQWKNDPL